jgi:murein endopeptidase
MTAPVLAKALAALALAVGGVAEAERERPRAVEWRNSVAIGTHEAGSLQRGVMLPSEGRTWITWDPVERDKPNRWWRRWGTDRLVRKLLSVLRAYAADHPQAPRVLVGDLSRPHGGDFGTRFGPIGHASHQNGLDVDVYYPRLDGREWTPRVPAQVDVALAQDLVDRFVAAGAERVFVGPSLPLTGPPGVVVPLVNHDNHLHFRLPAGG